MSGYSVFHHVASERCVKLQQMHGIAVASNRQVRVMFSGNLNQLPKLNLQLNLG